MNDTPVTDGETPEAEKPTLGQRIIAEVKFFAGLAVVMLCFLTFVWGHYKIPSESMQPTLEVGDHLYVSKFAYGYSRHSLIFGMHKLPFLKDGRIFTRMPKRGDVVVFRNPHTGVVMIKRLVGLPGDKIQTIRGRLYLNDKLIERTPVETFYYREHRGMTQQVTEFSEQFPGEKQAHHIYERNDIGWLDNKGPFIVPEKQFFFMGDNRDNSEDSRAPSGPNMGGPGMVPLDYLIGRADMMVYSLKKCEQEEGLKCPGFRAFKPL